MSFSPTDEQINQLRDLFALMGLWNGKHIEVTRRWIDSVGAKEEASDNPSNRDILNAINAFGERVADKEPVILPNALKWQKEKPKEHCACAIRLKDGTVRYALWSKFYQMAQTDTLWYEPCNITDYIIFMATPYPEE